MLEAARGKQIIFMPARHDHHRVQTGDGYAAYVAGQIVGAPIGVTTDEQASWWGGKGVGTVPHSLIAAYGGNTVLAATKFADWAPEDLNVTVLVDFENDSVETALDVARALGPRLWGVRLDTSENLVDRSLWNEMGDFRPTGVNERLVRKVRDALDADGFEHVKIVASGGFTVEKIEEFEQAGVPVDAYGVGSSLIRGQNDFTADVVMTDGRPSAKVGAFRANPRLEVVASAPELVTLCYERFGDVLLSPMPGHSASGVGRADDVHSGRGEALERRVRLVRVVDRARDDHRRRAVLEQVDALGELPCLAVAREQVVDRPGDAVALRLARDDDRVEPEQLLDQLRRCAGRAPRRRGRRSPPGRGSSSARSAGPRP